MKPISYTSTLRHTLSIAVVPTCHTHTCLHTHKIDLAAHDEGLHFWHGLLGERNKEARIIRREINVGELTPECERLVVHDRHLCFGSDLSQKKASRML